MLGYKLFWGTLKLIGTWLLFRKCGRKGRYSLIPFVNHYQLGVCADREKDGRKSGVTAICAQANYNDLPMVTIW